jgi:hypothetical protein
MDYDWFHMLFPDLARAYCLTLIRGVPPRQFLGRLGAGGSSRQIRGVDALVKTASPGFIGACPVGNWTLAVEPGGVLGTTLDRVLGLTISTRLVSHSRNASAVDQFCWLENGSARLCFQPLFPSRRSGSDAHDYVDLMRDVGFAVDASDEYRQGMQAGAAFALAEELTGVRITPDLLDEVPYECGIVPAA